MRRLLSFVVALAWAGTAAAQAPQGNPLVEAARTIGANGLGSETLAQKAGWPFKPTGGRNFAKKFLAGLVDEAESRAALEKSVLKMIDQYEELAVSVKQANDPATALAVSVGILNSVAKAEPLDDEAVLALAPRLRAVLAKVPATDAQKQEFYEYVLAASGLVAALNSAATDPDARAKLPGIAETQLQGILGTKSSAIDLKGGAVAIRGAKAPSIPTSPLTFARPTGWREEGEWLVGEVREDSNVHAARIRVVPAVPAQGSFGDALRAAWKRYVPEEAQGKASGMTFRRYAGDGLVTHFVCGSAPQKGRKWDTLYTVYLVDCGTMWQPLVVAQTWNDAGSASPIFSPWTISGSFRTSMGLVEGFLKGLSCPAAKDKPLVDRAALAGKFFYGTASGLQWVKVYTGSTTMTSISYSGSLELLPTGAFTEKYRSAGGVAGALKFRGFKAKGNWTVKGDLLTLTDTAYDQGDGVKRKLKSYRIAGVVSFADGEKVVVLKDDLAEPVNPLTVGDRSAYYSTKEKK